MKKMKSFNRIIVFWHILYNRDAREGKALSRSYLYYRGVEWYVRWKQLCIYLSFIYPFSNHRLLWLRLL